MIRFVKRRNLLLLFMAVMFFVGGIVSLFSETLCLYVEERTNGEQGPFPPPVKEGIYNGLFEENYIVFDTGDKAIYNVDWKKGLFATVLEVAREGGARYVIAVKVDSKLVKDKERGDHVSINSRYYVVDVEKGVLLGKGSLSGSNRGEEKEVNQSKLGFSIGMKIARAIDKSIKKHTDAF